VTTVVDSASLARDERAELSELLAELTPAQWDAATLCKQWSVRQVVAHIYSYEGFPSASPARLVSGATRPGQRRRGGEVR